MKLKAEFLRESNLIEGIDFSEDVYLSSYNGVPIDNPYVDNSITALRHIEQAHIEKFSVLDVLQIHRLLMNDFREDAGQLRDGIVMVGGHTPPPPSVLYYHLDSWINYVNSSKCDPLRAHFWLEAIHPFSDGNGRAGRLIWAWHMKQLGHPIRPILQEFNGKDFIENRACYYQAIRKFERERQW